MKSTTKLADVSGLTNTPSEPSSEEDERNEIIAHAMKLLLAARDRVLTLSEQRVSSSFRFFSTILISYRSQHLTPLVPQLTSTRMVTSLDLAPIVSTNPSLAYPLFLSLLCAPHSNSNPQGPFRYLDVLKHLPPTLPTFDLLGRLLRDPTAITDETTGGQTTIADLVRMEVLGWFIHQSIERLDATEREEREGLISDDRFAKGVQNVSTRVSNRSSVD
jgi:hypothetical protein